jgi:hypothetical protein
MKNTLQYAYTISVFMGVLLTAYLMMNQGTSLNVPNRNFQNGGFRSEAQVVDPAVRELLDMENALAKVPKEKSREKAQESSEAPAAVPQLPSEVKVPVPAPGQ